MLLCSTDMYTPEHEVIMNASEADHLHTAREY